MSEKTGPSCKSPSSLQISRKGWYMCKQVGVTLFFSLLLTVATAHIAEAGTTKFKEGSFYNYSQVGVRKMKVNGNRIDLVFKPVDEQFYWCPGIKVQKTKVATVVTFIRCKTSKTCGVDVKASIEKRLIRKLSFETNGLDVYVRNGPEKFKLVHKSPKSKLLKEKQKQQQKQTGSNRR